MIVGVPREIKTDEYRVAMIPVGVEELTRAGNRVLIQAGAGQGSGINDEQYAMHGAEIVPSAEEIWTQTKSGSRSRSALKRARKRPRNPSGSSAA